MRLVWKIAAPVACLIVIGSAAVGWSIYQKRSNEQNLAETAQSRRVRAEKGDSKAQFELSDMYYRGRGVPQSYVEAFRWCRSSAEQGYAKAEYGLAHLYLAGEGVSQDYSESRRWARKSVDQGYAPANYGVGFMYREGKGVQQDYAEAARWYRKGADLGDAMAQDELGLVYYKGQGVPVDYSESARWYRKAADQGYPLAESGIGFMLFYGHGVPQDRAEAERWFHKAASQGDSYALRTVSANLAGSRIVFLLVRLVGGMLLASSFLSLNIFERGTGLRGRRQRVICATGVLWLCAAGFDWYGYTHHKIWYLTYGLNAFTSVKWLLDAIVFVLLVYIVVSGKETGTDDPPFTPASLQFPS
jgi:TPR repeat protein